MGTRKMSKGRLAIKQYFIVVNSTLWPWLCSVMLWVVLWETTNVRGQFPNTCGRRYREYLEFYCPITCDSDGGCETTDDRKTPICYCYDDLLNEKLSIGLAGQGPYYQISCSNFTSNPNSFRPVDLMACNDTCVEKQKLRFLRVCVSEGKTAHGRFYGPKTYCVCGKAYYEFASKPLGVLSLPES